MSADPDQLDLFSEQLFPVREALSHVDLDRYRAKIKRAMSRAIRECGHDRATIAARMAAFLGLAGVSRASLDAYTAESKTSHDISLLRFSAFVHATGAPWLWDEVASIHGITVLYGDEALLAKAAFMEQQRRVITAELRALRRKHIRLAPTR